jgi:DNA-binding Lrp family transcriptional regulator
MNVLDKTEIRIVRELIRNPRISDNQISRRTGIPVRTVNRKRKRLEEVGLLSYYTHLNMGSEGTGQLPSRHLYLITFKLGIAQEKLIQEIHEEPNVRTVFSELIYESHLAEIDGHTSLVMIIEGRTDDDINAGFNSRIVPSLQKNHGKDSIVNVSTIRLGPSIRLFHNYIPMVNMERGYLKETWRNDAIFPQ